jgi:membrane protein DedA with SNARE-associated domain
MNQGANTAATSRPAGPPLRVLLAMYACLYALGTAGGIFGPGLVKEHPELLLAMSSVNRHLLLSIGAGISIVPFVAIAFVRLLLADPICYLLGRGWGDKTVSWFEQNAAGGTGGFGWLLKLFQRAAPVAIFLAPNNLICFLAGRANYPIKKMVALDLAGTAGRIGLMWYLGKTFESELKNVVDWIADNQFKMIAALLVLSVLNSLRKSSRQPKTMPPPPTS